MTRGHLFTKPWVRFVVFIWMIVFPIIFIVLPALEMFADNTPKSWTPVWALIMWMLGPWAVSIVMKYSGGSE